jgi:hypothetical protein
LTSVAVTDVARFTVVVSPSVPVGGVVELLSGSTIVAEGKVENDGGVDEATFVVFFDESGTFTFTAEYLGDGVYQPSTSNSITINVDAVGRQGTNKR